MNDQMDMAMGDADGEADEIYDQILGEVGMGMNHNMNINSNAVPQPMVGNMAPAPVPQVGDDMQARLD